MGLSAFDLQFLKPRARGKEMEQRMSCRQQLGCSLMVWCVVVVVLSFCGGCVEGYENYTVGGSLGWYDNLQKPSVNYRKWAAPHTFSLGDFLIFNTDSNHSVVQTYNITTYKRCDYDNAQENDTTEWSAADPSATSPQPVTLPIPLLKEGITYFFSGYYDGEQCRHGQHFKINVTHGQGLPESLKEPSAESPSPTSPGAGDDESAPDTVVSSNFNHPKEGSDDDDHKQASGSVSLTVGFMKLLHGRSVNGVLTVLGIVCILG